MRQVFTAILALVLLLVGCTTVRSVRVPVPSVRAVAYFDRADVIEFVVSEARRMSVAPPEVRFRDARYAIIDEESLRAIMRGLEQAGLRYRPEVLDCDDFASALQLLASVANGQLKAPVAVGVMNVWQVRPSGGVPGTGGKHALNFAVVQRRDVGWVLVVIEPQTGVILPWQDYPNQRFVTEVRL